MYARLLTVFLATVAAAQDKAPEKVDFAATIAPIFSKRCYECHGPKEHEAELRLDRKASVFHADQSKWVIQPGNPDDSELVRRIKLPKKDDEAMPAEGDRLTAEQIAAIERWIAEGATWPDTAPAADEPPPVEEFSIQLTPEQKQEVDATVEKLRQRGAVAGPVAKDLAALDVNLSLLRPAATDDDLATLQGIAPALVWLNVSRTGISDDGVAPLAQCTKLQRLHLAQTAIGDDAMRHLAGLHDLRFLNLFGTKVTDAGLEALHGLAKLEKLFLWETQVTDAGVAALRQALPHVVIDRGGYADEILQVATDQAAADAKAKAGLPDGVANDKCPVSGEAVDTGVTLVHEGRTIAFCCTKCRAKFEKDPGKFAPNLPPKTEAKK